MTMGFCRWLSCYSSALQLLWQAYSYLHSVVCLYLCYFLQYERDIFECFHKCMKQFLQVVFKYATVLNTSISLDSFLMSFSTSPKCEKLLYPFSFLMFIQWNLTSDMKKREFKSHKYTNKQ